jgi:colanic acid/amylovoran biosynthesis glycosyltransferase
MTLGVLHVAPTWLPQTQTWVHTQVDCVPPDRVAAHVFCESVENLDQFPVRHLHNFAEEALARRLWHKGLRRLGVRRYNGFAVRVARDTGARVFHSHFGDVGWTYIGAARAAGAAHVVTFYGYDAALLPRQTGWLERLRTLFREASAVLCEGPHMASCLAQLGCPRDKLRVQRLGVRLDRLAYRPRQWRLGEPLKVLIASTFTEKKGIPYGLEALARLRRHVALKITLIGDARSNPEGQGEKRRIVETLRKTGLEDITRRPGFLTHAEMIREAYDHHVFLAPSVTSSSGDAEGGAPVALIEMAATGMLVVSSRHCDIPEVIVDGVTGFLAEERDVDGIAACLRRAVDGADAWPHMLAAGRRHIEERFDCWKQGAHLASIYEDVSRRGGTRPA